MLLNLPLVPRPGEPLRVLALGAHSDDIEIGCGATLVKLVESGLPLDVYWIVFSGNEQRQREAIGSAEDLLAVVPQKRIAVHAFRDGFFPYVGAEIKECFEAVKREFDPDITFTHYRLDRHQDHRTISDLTWNTFRSHLVLEYEIPKADGDLGNPNLFVQVSDEQANRKVGVLMRHFGTQRSRHWFSEETFLGLMRIRGMESGGGRYAEAFHARKVVLGI